MKQPCNSRPTPRILSPRHAGSVSALFESRWPRGLPLPFCEMMGRSAKTSAEDVELLIEEDLEKTMFNHSTGT